jgi:hypothetical protein
MFRSNYSRLKKLAKENSNSIWSSERKEFFGRDGASWAKISIFYAVFYLLLCALFTALLMIFMKTIDINKPTYFNEQSVMAYGTDGDNRANTINPGLGFRPHLDPESSLIKYSMSANEADLFSPEPLVNSIRIFLK